MFYILYLVGVNQGRVKKYPVEEYVQAAPVWLQVFVCIHANQEPGPTPDVSFQGGLPQVPMRDDAHCHLQLKYCCIVCKPEAWVHT